MLIVLLDCSSSMHEPFRGEATLETTTGSAAVTRKIDAACQALRECLGRASSSETVVVLGFAGGVVELARGDAIDGAELEVRIDSMERGGRADIEAAMAAAARALDSDPTDFDQLSRVILITDGLLEVRSAERLELIVYDLVRLATIDVFLIDPSRRELETLRRITQYGKRTTVESADALSAAVMALLGPNPRSRRMGLDEEFGADDDADRPVVRLACLDSMELDEEFGADDDLAPDVEKGPSSRLFARSGSFEVRRSGGGRRGAGLRVPHVEDVTVTVAHAPGVARGTWCPLDVFVHVASLEDEVSRIVRAERGSGAARGCRGAKIPRGTVVRIEPRIENAELDIEAVELRWLEDIQRAVFRFRPTAGATELRGSIDLYVAHALLCSVPIAVMVLDDPQDALPASIASARMMEAVFVSYATEDRPVVEYVTRPYRELGITVFIDKDFLHAGDTTGEALRAHIERADVFQLFWSTRSSKKPWVEREWRHALTLTGPAGRKGARFIRPLVWERRPPPWPPELAALQFGRLDAAWFEANVESSPSPA